MRAIWKRELRAYFYTPVGYVFLCVFLSAASVIFYLTLLSRGSGDLPAFISFLSLLWMLLSPILTMRLLAEERQKKTDQLLLTSPASLPSIVLGKYLAAVAVLMMATVLTLVYAGIISMYGKIYPAELAVNLLGFLLLGCAFTALDLFISSCAANPVTAAIMAFGANFFLWILDLVEQAVTVGWISDALRFISLYHRNEPLIAGELSFASVIFDLSFIAVFLALTVFHLDGRRIRRLRYRAVSALLTLLLIPSLTLLSIGAQYLEKRNGWSVDASFNSITSHTEATRQLLEDLPYDVHIRALFPRGDEDIELMALLDRYAANPHITWEQMDPRLNPGLIRKYTTTARAPEEYDLIVTCEDTGRWRLIKSDEYIGARSDPETGETIYDQLNYERVISGAVDYVSRERVPRVVILYGFREDIDRNNAAYLERFLTFNRYEVVYQQLDDPAFTADARDLLVFLSPQRDLTDEEYQKIKAFAAGGGSLLFTRDADDPIGKNYAALLLTYGFRCLDGVVVATEAGTYYDGIATYLLPVMESTDVTMDLLIAEATHIRLPLSAAFEMPTEKTDRYLNTAAVLSMPETAYLEQDNAAGRAEDEPAGPFALALQARRITSEGNVSRAFIIGNTAALMTEDSYAVTDMPYLTIRVMEFLLDLDVTSLDIISRDASRPLLQSGSKRTGVVMIVTLPAAALLAALLVLPKRRRF